MKPVISVLVAARKDSKYLAKFLFGLYENSSLSWKQIEVLVMLNAEDTWNSELESLAHRGQLPYKTIFHREDSGLGRAGLHLYFNALAQEAVGDWLIYFCDDHFINAPNPGAWDQYFLSMIQELNIDPKDVYCLIPKFDNAGAMNQMISRGYYEALGGVVGYHGWIDSYLNDVNGMVFSKHDPRVIRMNTETFHDFTHDKPGPMEDAAVQSKLSEAAKKMPKYGSPEYLELVKDGATRLKEALSREAV